MKTKLNLAIMFLAVISLFIPAGVRADDKPSEKISKSAPNIPDSPLKAIGIILVSAEDNSKVILLTKVATKDAPEGKMIGIPIELDEMGNKIVKEYGINGLASDEKDGMERIQNESKEKVVFVEGTLKLSSGKGKLAIKNYGSAKDLKPETIPVKASSDISK